MVSAFQEQRSGPVSTTSTGHSDHLWRLIGLALAGVGINKQLQAIVVATVACCADGCVDDSGLHLLFNYLSCNVHLWRSPMRAPGLWELTCSVSWPDVVQGD